MSCSQWIENDKLENDYQKECFGNAECQLDLSAYFKFDKDGKMPKGAPEHCYEDYTQVYI